MTEKACQILLPDIKFFAMKKLLILIFVSLMIVACSSKKSGDIVIYGSTDCDHCMDFKAQMDSAGYTYVFKDVKDNQVMVDEMMAEVKAYGFKEYINLPVVIVNKKHFFSAPKIEMVSAVLAE